MTAATTTRTAPADKKPPVTRPQCGTHRGYYVHWRAGEDACEKCKRALAEYCAARLAAMPPQQLAAMKSYKAARRAAMTALGRHDRKTYTQLIAEEKRRLLLKYRRELSAKEREAVYATARYRALRRMIDRDPDQYQKFLAEHLADREPTP